MEGTILECKATGNTVWEHRNHLSYLEACLQSGKWKDWLEDRVGPVLWGGGCRAGGAEMLLYPKTPCITGCHQSLKTGHLGDAPLGFASAFLTCLNLSLL